MSAVLKINEELNGIELYFDTKPNEETRKFMKSNGFRWAGFKGCWYSRQSEKAFKVANSLVGNTVTNVTVSTPAEKVVAKKPVKTLSLWNATQWEELKGINTDQEAKIIAKEIRSHIKKRFPQCKFSVTVPYYGRISFDVKSSPYDKDSTYLKAIFNYCDKLLNAYRHCYSPSDPYTDYAGHYNFSGWVTIAWDYKQTEATEEIKQDMKEFDSKLAQFEKAEEERKEQEYQEYLKEQEQRNAEYKKHQEEEQKQVENIYNNVDVKELNENDQYFIAGAEFAHLNKNSTLDQYKEEAQKGEYYLQDVKVTKEVHFNSLEALNNFSNMLLNDFDFLAETGGSYTDDNRINSMTDFYNMDDEEQKTVKWNLYGVAIYYNNKLQFVVDCQGYTYARYVGLTDNGTIEKNVSYDQTINNEELAELKQAANTLEDISTSVIDELNIIDAWQGEHWNEYKESFKNKLNKYNIKLTKKIIQQLDIEALKVSMYKLLIEVDGIQEQFKNADIQQGDKLTLFYISDWGSIVTNRMTFDSVIPSKYAQYDNAVKITFKPEGKRNLHYKFFHSDLLVYKGSHSLPDEVLNHVEVKNGMKLTRSKYGSCDHRQYDEILNHFEQHGLKPIVNTYKPVF